MSTHTIHFADTTVAVPADCPEPALFKAAFMELMLRRFATPERAAAALAQWRAIKTVPQPFADHQEAAHHYQQACLALNPQAAAWTEFEDELFRACLEFDEEGDPQTPAVPGWSPYWSDLAG